MAEKTKTELDFGEKKDICPYRLIARHLPRKKENVSSILITGSNFMNKKLIEQKTDEYVNYSLIDICNVCNDYVPIHNHHDGKNYLTWVGNRLYCQKCMAEPSARKRES